MNTYSPARNGAESLEFLAKACHIRYLYSDPARQLSTGRPAEALSLIGGLGFVLAMIGFFRYAVLARLFVLKELA